MQFCSDAGSDAYPLPGIGRATPFVVRMTLNCGGLAGAGASELGAADAVAVAVGDGAGKDAGAGALAGGVYCRAGGGV